MLHISSVHVVMMENVGKVFHHFIDKLLKKRSTMEFKWLLLATTTAFISGHYKFHQQGKFVMINVQFTRISLLDNEKQ